MRLSQYFIPLLKEVPSEAQIVSHRLMLRAGLIRQLNAGIYNWLPLGLKVLRNVEKIIREEMDKVGCLEVLMPCIQPAELWQESGRYDAYGKEMLRIKDRHEREMLYGPTNEEVITDIFRKNIKSYKELPKNLYQIQWKFRDEIRPRFGVMRGREFLMKDAYSFDIDFEGAKRSYDTMFETYIKIFKRMGLRVIPVQADSGAIGGNLSHEFQVIASTGESEVFYDAKLENIINKDEINIEALKSMYAAADEKHNQEICPIPLEQVKKTRGIEVGHVFYFGNKYTQPMNTYVTNNKGEQVLVEMGSYGIGVSRLVGAIIEASHDEDGIIWPESVAPFRVGIINLKVNDEKCKQVCDELYATMLKNNIEVLYDDRDENAGSKFATQDLIGTPLHIVVGPKGVAAGTVEMKVRGSKEKVEISKESVLAKISGSRG